MAMSGARCDAADTSLLPFSHGTHGPLRAHRREPAPAPRATRDRSALGWPRLLPRLLACHGCEWETVQNYTTRIRALNLERRTLLQVTYGPAIAQVLQLHRLRGIGLDSAWLYVMEFFAWRQL